MRSALPRTFEMVESTRFRARVVAAIETLVDLLDELDHDPDLEPDNDDEPSLGWREARGGEGLCPTSADEAELGSWDRGRSAAAYWPLHSAYRGRRAHRARAVRERLHRCRPR